MQKLLKIFSVQEDNDILLYPLKSGYVQDKVGLPCHLVVASFTNEDINFKRVEFTNEDINFKRVESTRHHVNVSEVPYEFLCHPFTLVFGEFHYTFFRRGKFSSQ